MSIDAKVLAEKTGIPEIRAGVIQQELSTAILESLGKAGFREPRLKSQVAKFLDRWFEAVMARDSVTNVMEVKRFRALLDGHGDPQSLKHLLDNAVIPYLRQDEFLLRDIKDAVDPSGAANPVDPHAKPLLLTDGPNGAKQAVINGVRFQFNTVLSKIVGDITASRTMTSAQFDNMLRTGLKTIEEGSMALWEQIVANYTSQRLSGIFIDSLIKLANELDERGFYKQADAIDAILRTGV